MEHLRYRSKIRVIAVVDLILSGISTIVPVMLFLIAMVMTLMKYSEDYKGGEQNPFDTGRPTFDNPAITNSFAAGVFAVIFWVLFAVTAIIVIIQLIAGFKLVNATEIGKDPIEAARLSRFWRNVAIVFTALLLISAFQRNRSARANRSTMLQLGGLIMDLFILGSMIFRCLGIYLVQKFITELDHVASNGILPNYPGQIPIPMSVMSNGGAVYSHIPPQQGFSNPGYPAGPFQHQPPNYNDIMMRPPYEKQWINNPISQC